MERTARIAGVLYLVVFVTGFAGFLTSDKFPLSGSAAAAAANILAHETLFRVSGLMMLIATVFYVAVTAVFYFLFKPAGPSLSLTAAFFSLVGCAVSGAAAAVRAGALVVLKTVDQAQTLAVVLLKVNVQAGNVGMIFFGFYCVLIGCLIFRSTFLPRTVGVLMLIAGLGYLTLLWPPLASRLIPFNMLPGMIGEAALTVWLLLFGVNAERWNAQAVAA